MSSFKFSDDTISEREIMMALPSIIIGVTVLSLPNQIAQVTYASDGWIGILIGGIIIAVLTWLGAKLAAQFPNQNFMSYTSSLVGKPIAYVFTLFFIVTAISIAAFVTRSFSDILKGYLFDQTPTEVLALALVLITIYAVSGSRAGVFRLAMMFLPLIIAIVIATILFNLQWIEANNFFPLFRTDIKGYIEAIGYSLSSYIGFAIVLFYVFIVNKPKKAPKAALYGIAIPTVLYLMIYLVVIGVYGNYTTSKLLHPTIGLAKRVELPGGIFERIESVFFVIWTMAVFNTTTIALDVAVLLTKNMFKRAKKINILFFIAPITYYLSMLPQNYTQLEKSGTYISLISLNVAIFIILLLFIVAWIKGAFSK